jgi:ribosomal protein S18 acetylase RimI-like enzyme
MDLPVLCYGLQLMAEKDGGPVCEVRYRHSQRPGLSYRGDLIRYRGAGVIRKARHTDLDHLIDIENRSFKGDRLSRPRFRHLLTKGNATTLVDEDQGRIRGYALVLYNKRTALARLYSIVVDSRFRGAGLGRQLLDAAEEDAVGRGCAIMRLEVRRDNRTAINLYRGYGYRQFGSVPDYYEDHMEALRFEKSLVPHLP